ncbi:ABC transporter permease [Amycolatopsis balhimycina DSM 5908]|uniref:ABC transporter permease n=1 Tax=Amycolatopsis balhimycina DSM 5908 TaxID=1081091 RepID=A0A428VX69_AMYBA|nr:ABC transporter permease [Amycolatopsis balhimycina]RSM35421.1 ABC transporter permease [Amycolatopsis balhimycina DSM 5908]
MNTTYLSLEIKRILRSPQFTIFTIGMPVAMYLLFGAIWGDAILPGGLHSSTQTMVGMAAYGASGGALFTGTRVAQERTDGWQRQLRLTPMRGPGYLVVKVASAMAVALPVLLAIFFVGFLRGEPLTLAEWGRLLVFLWAATLPFAVLGLAIGLFGKGDTVGAVTGALMMPLGLLGGLWIPLEFLPGWMSTLAHFMPTYWLRRVGLDPLTHTSGTWVATIVLAGWLVVPALIVVRRFRLDTARL